MRTGRPGESLLWWERWTVVLLLATIVGFGVLVEIRSAFLSRRMGDLGVYLRSAWAVRQGGQDLYNLRCDNGWSYNYPPLLAIVLVPLADPPTGQLGRGILSYEATVAVWYAFNVFCLAWGIHVLASALEAAAGEDAAPGSRRWWTLRLWPMLACLTAVGSTLMKGQVNLIVLGLLCGFLAALLRGRSMRAGLFLAGPICLKIFPVFLLLLPLWRRNARCLIGCALGSFIGLVAIPVMALGPTQTAACYQDLSRVLLAPALGLGADESRAKELTGVSGTDNHALVAMLHHAVHRDVTARPRQASPIITGLHWAMGATMTLLTLAAFRRPSVVAGREAAREVIFGGAIIMTMLLICPVAHLHYFCLSVPLVMGMVMLDRGERAHPHAGLFALMGLQFASIVLEQLPGLEMLRDLRLAGYGAVLVWAAGCLLGSRVRKTSVPDAILLGRAA